MVSELVYRQAKGGGQSIVLILIVVEYGLGAIVKLFARMRVGRVLILIVVEYGLGDLKLHKIADQRILS